MIYTVAQQKGGVGKTTTAANIAILMAQRGRRILVVDVDPQFALTRQLGVETRELPLTVVDVLRDGVDLANVIVKDVHGLIDVVPANRALGGVEMALVGEMGREAYLQQALEPVLEQYDDIIIDTPPNLGLLTVNALMCADVVIAPVSAEDEGSVQGIAELRATGTKLMRLRGNEPPIVVLVTKWKRQRIMTDVVEQTLQDMDLTVAVRVPSRAAVHRAAVTREPIAISAPGGDAAQAYEQLVAELLTVGATR